MLQPHDQVGPYALVKYLGSGAFGEVWLAEKRTAVTTIQVALKLPKKSDVNLETVRQEAAIWEQAKGHPNVLPLIDADIYQVGGREYVGIASEYADGGSLREWLEQNGGKAPTMQAAVEMCAGILSGLAHLHARNIVHRDLKPENIMLQGDTPRLNDFGLARVLKDGVSSYSAVSGTPLYMAPEAFDGKRSAKSDIWSAGVILYQMLTGRLPFAAPDMMVLMKAILLDAPAPLPAELPENLRATILQALQKESEQRLASASDMRAALLKTNFVNNFANTETETIIDATLPRPVSLADIRRKMLTARSAWELREAKFEVEEFLKAQPFHPEAQMLRENITQAMAREVALTAPQATAAYSTQPSMVAPPPPMKSAGGWGKMLVGGGIVAALLVGVISLSLFSALNRSAPMTNANAPLLSGTPVGNANVASNTNANTSSLVEPTVIASVEGKIANRVVTLILPEYPSFAIKNGISGIVKVRVEIDVAGVAQKAETISSNFFLKKVCEDAARESTFGVSPTSETGVISYEFVLPNTKKNND